MAIKTTHNLRTGFWQADVEAVQAAIGHLATGNLRANDCRVTFFEIADDRHLHVNVHHRFQTTSAKGWSGPACLPEGFVHNRTFGDVEPSEIIRHIQEMIFATRQ